MATNTPIFIKRFNGTDYDKLQPETTWTQVTDKPTTFTPTAHTHSGADITTGTVSTARLGTGTADSSTFLRGDGSWAIPGGGERKFYNSISGTSGAWYDLFTVSDGATGALFVSIQTYAHDDLLFTVGTGYSTSAVNTITILNCVYNPSGPYASITGVRVTNTGLVQAQFTWSSGPTVDIDVAVYGSGTLPTLAASLTANATSYTIDDTVSITGLQGKIRSENGFVQGTTAIPAGTGTTNEITYWSGTNTVGTLSTATYPSLTELSYVKGTTSALQTQLNNKASSTHTHGNISNAGGWQNTPQTIASGDTFVITKSGLLNNASLAFGSGTTTYLRNDGTWGTPAGSGVSGSGTTNELTYWTGASSIGTLSTATYPSLTELSYVKGVTSAIQTQFTNKMDDVRIVRTHKATQTTANSTTPVSYHTVTLLPGHYYQVFVTGAWSKLATTNSVGAVITWATGSTTGTPTIHGYYRWAQNTAATADTIESEVANFTTSTTAHGFTTTATTGSVSGTYYGFEFLVYTGTTDNKTITFYIATSAAPSTGTVALDRIAITAVRLS